MPGPYSTPRPLRPTDDLANFDSGKRELDDYLRRRSWANHQQGAARCFVTCDSSGRVVGYYALAASAVSRQDVPAARYRRNMPDEIPVVLLARLAIHIKEQRQGLGRQLVRDAVLRAVAAAETIGVRALLVHARDEQAQRYYEQFDFEPSPSDPLHLFMLIKDARAAMEA